MLKWLGNICRGIALWLVVVSPFRFGRFAPTLFNYGLGAPWRRIEDDEDDVVLGLQDDPDA